MELEGGDSWGSSQEGGGSNAIILPGRKKHKKKKTKEEREKHGEKEKSNLSKSQKRKLRKLEEARETELLLKQTLEDLEKYKIPENVYPLLHCTKNIGQSETLRIKRRRLFQYAKAGMEVPSADQNLKRKGGKGTLFETHSESEENQAVEVEAGEAMNGTSCSLGSSLQHSCRSCHEMGDVTDVTSPAKEVSALSKTMPVEDSLTISCIRGEPTNTKLLDETNKSKEFVSGYPSQTLHCLPGRAITVPVVVHASRPKEVDEKRKDLPIVMMEQEIMEAISDNSTVIICGKTGCGKTTQVPQFLYEAGYGSKQSMLRGGMIGVTQPRRVAVLATAKRVAYELGLRLGKDVGFQVRHDKNVKDSCSMKFMTDGILLREVQADFLLKHYSVIILDEAHERSLNTDILIGMLSRVIRAREEEYKKQQQMIQFGEKISPKDIVSPLKVVLMSATLRVEDFVSGERIFLRPPPVIDVPDRQFPVTIHFSKRTEVVDYIGQAYKKVLAIHKRLPPGGILVFVTGQREVEFLCQKLRKASRELVRRKSIGNRGIEVNDVPEMSSYDGFDMSEINEAFENKGISEFEKTDRFTSYEEDTGSLTEDESDISYDSQTDSDLDLPNDENSPIDETDAQVLGENCSLNYLKAAFEALAGKTMAKSNLEGKRVTDCASDKLSKEAVTEPVKRKAGEDGFFAGALSVLPLYAMLPAAAQLRVFEDTKEGDRLVVVSTNVAETSLTIPGIKYVVDTGREKVKNYNTANGMETFEVHWISKASAAQRAGRAGRTGPGHCYRLYSSAVFSNIFPDFSVAEISKVPVDGVILLLKSLNIDKVANFPFPTPPSTAALVKSEKCLRTLEALDDDRRLTSLGKAMARYPMSPRHSRMILTAVQILREVKSVRRPDLVLGYAIAAAAALSLSNPFMIQHEESHCNEESLQQENPDNPDSEKMPSKEKNVNKKKITETARIYRAKFSHSKSDALATAYTLQCFELSENPKEFCKKYSLHLKTMEEMSKLRKQLLRLVCSEIVACDNEFSWTHGTTENVECAWRTSSDKHPIRLDEEEILCQAICAGWADRVAMRSSLSAASSDGIRRSNVVRYQACMVDETVFLHRWSSLSSLSPDFLVYNELLYTKHPYMHGATSVKPEWLVTYAPYLCSFSAHVDDKPSYDPQTDRVLSWFSPTFGDHHWELPRHRLPIDFKDKGEEKQRARVVGFAYVFLKGQVLPCLKSVQNHMVDPVDILKHEVVQKRVFNLLSKMNSGCIDSCSKLREAWEKNPMELHSEILDWFQKPFHSQFNEIWLKMQEEVFEEPRERFGVKKKKRKIKMVI